jgi:P27 family predicted phage terminase small subunit
VNRNEPTPPPVRPDPPEYLDLDALGVWRRLAPSLEARGILTVWDVDTFAAFCTAVVHHRRAVAMVNKSSVVLGRTPSTYIKHPAMQVVRDQAALIVTLAGRFGLTPSDRSAIRLELEDDPAGYGILD